MTFVVPSRSCAQPWSHLDLMCVPESCRNVPTANLFKLAGQRAEYARVTIYQSLKHFNAPETLF